MTVNGSDGIGPKHWGDQVGGVHDEAGRFSLSSLDILAKFGIDAEVEFPPPICCSFSGKM